MISKQKIYNFIYLLLVIFGIFYLIFTEKNVVHLLKNENKINDKKKLLAEKEKIKIELERQISSFSNSEIFKELILKEKLFLKNKNDKLLLYELDH